MLPQSTGCVATECLLYGEGMDWREMSPETLDLQYSPSKFGKKPLADYLEEYHELSLGHDHSQLRIPGQPLLIFIHGGYWQRLSAADSLFNAFDAVRENISLHAVEYTLAPHASIDTMIHECMQDVLAVIDELTPSRVVIAGSSAGAHLTAMCLRNEHISRKVHGAVLLSGIYDIRPLVHTPTNDPLFLTEEAASALSPQLLPPSPGISDALCVVGEHEPDEFKRQNSDFANYLTQQGCTVTTSVVESKDHFDLPYDLLRADSFVGEWVLAHLKDSSR